MENDTTNKSGGEDSGAKKNWRERLGINKELPKIAAEFREEKRAPQRPVVRSPAGNAPVVESEQNAARTGQPIARPAPMAPRRTASSSPPRQQVLPAAEPAVAGEPAVAPQAPAPVARPAQPRPEIPQSDFSARLRAQREAAERLAQQRHVAGRRGLAAHQANGQAPEGNAGANATPAADTDAAAPGASRPKFTFAPEEFTHPAGETDETVAPEEFSATGQALADVPDASQSEAPVNVEMPAARPEAQPDTTPGIVVGVRQPPREIPQRATASSLVPPPAPPSPPPPLRPTLSADVQPNQANYAPQQPAYGNAPSLQTGAVPPAYARVPQQPPIVEPSAPQMPPQAPPPLRAEPAMADARPQRPINYVDRDLEDVFEDTPRPAPANARAGVEDYNAAYRDFEDEFEGEEEERRSGSGPIILILALLTVAAIAGALVYFYRSNAGTSTTTTGEVPVISAPQDPVKTEPDQSAQPAQPAQPVGRKQIYDRILGEETLEPETVLPSEEAPQVPAVEPGATVVPGGSGVEPLPLPLPPPPGSSDQQGSLSSPAANQAAAITDTSQSIASGAATSGKTARADQPAISTVTTGKVDQTTLAAIPPPEPLSDAAGAAATTAGASEPAAGITQTPATTTPSTTTLTATAAAILPKPPLPRVKPRRRIAAVSQTRVQTAPAPAPAPTVPSTFTNTRTTTSGSGPVLLAPQAPAPAAPAPAETQASSGLQLPSFFQNSETTTRRSAGRLADDDPLAGTRGSVNTSAGTTTAGGAQQLTALQPQPIQPAVTQPAAPQPAPSLLPPSQTAPALVAPAPAPAPQPSQPAASGGSGYVVQLASYRSQAEAQNEYQRLRSRHAGIVGNLPSRIQKAELGAAGTFYRLGVGPLGTKQAATSLCNSLIASGEKDCLVRRQ